MLAPFPDDEEERLRQLRELVVLDSAPEPLFDSIARLASQVCGVPIALVSLIDSERQWFKANVGLPGVNETPRDVAFCAHAIQDDALFEVPDATQDARFSSNPLVTGTPDIRFYAGAPLKLPSGQRVGTLCVIDRQARRLDAAQADVLKSLGRIACEGLVMRRDLILRSLAARSVQEQALRDREAFLRRMGHVAGVGGWQLDLPTGAITWSEHTRIIHEVGPEYVPQLDSAIEFYAPEARPVIQQAVASAMQDGGAWDLELPFITARGRRCWVRTMGEAEFEDDRPVRLVGTFQDITLAVDARKKLQMQSATLHAVTDAVPAIVAVVGADRRYRLVNTAFERWAGQPRSHIVGSTMEDVLSAEELHLSQSAVDRVLGGETVQFERENADRRHGRHLAMSYFPLIDESAGHVVDGFIGVGLDITEHRREQSRLLDLSERDGLTGLLNRAGLERLIQAEVSTGSGAHVALLYVDLDRFKPVNDTYGHATGDQVLIQFGQRMEAAIRPTDIVARLGGDEFAVLLFDVREAGHAQAVADKIIAAARTPFHIHGHTITLGASVGVAFGASGPDGWTDLVHRADVQLYRSKREGRDRQSGTTDWVPPDFL